MAIDLDSGTGLFDRLGKIGYLIQLINSRFGGSASNDFPTELNDALVKYDGASNIIRAAIDDLASQFAEFQVSPNTFLGQLRTVAWNTLIEMAHADNPLPAKTISFALDELIRQMAVNGESVDASAPSIASLVDGPRYAGITGATQANPVVITSNGHGLANQDIVTIKGVSGMTEINNRQFTVSGVTANTFELNGEDGTGHTAYTGNGQWFANDGNATLITSILDGTGKTLENSLPEDLVVEITRASTAGAETGSVNGEANEAQEQLQYNWPSGSGGSATVTVRNPSSTTANWLTNGDMEAFTANAPDSWTIDVGSAGTEILEEATNVYRGSKALEYVGDSSTLTAISQAVTGLASRTPYPVCVRVRVDVVPAAGTLILDLYDGSAVINDDQGNANSLSIVLSSATTTYRAHTAVFRLPEPVPATVRFRVRLSVALSTSSSVFIDDIMFGKHAMTQPYTGGPYLALIRGAKNAAVDDSYVITVTNAQEGGFQTLFHRLFQLPAKLLPSNNAGGETIADSLIG